MINAYLHNVEDLHEKQEGFSLVRVPSNVYEGLSDQGKYSARIPSGCEIRFVMEEDKVTLKFFYAGEAKYAPQLRLYYGNFQGGWLWLDPYTLQCGYNEVVVERPSNIDRLRQVAKERGQEFSPDVMRISGFVESLYFIGFEGNVRPPKREELPQKRVLFYGSSITHGSLSQNINACYAALCGRMLGVDIFNKGLAGSCMLEDDTLAYVFSQDVDFHVVEAGTNCFYAANREWFAERVRKILVTHEKLCPQKPLFLIDELKINDEHSICTEIVSTLVQEQKNAHITFIDGATLLTSAEYLSADFIHPTLDGHFVMANNLYKIIKNTNIL